MAWRKQDRKKFAAHAERIFPDVCRVMRQLGAVGNANAVGRERVLAGLQELPGRTGTSLRMLRAAGAYSRDIDRLVGVDHDVILFVNAGIFLAAKDSELRANDYNLCADRAERMRIDDTRLILALRAEAVRLRQGSTGKPGDRPQEDLFRDDLERAERNRRRQLGA
jgi:hypothetical protein